MNIRNQIAWATAGIAMLAASFASAQRARLDDVTRDYRLDRSDAAAAIVVSDALRMPVRDVIYSARDCGRGVFDVAPAFVIGNSTGEDVLRVWRQRDGRRWLDYALDLRADVRGFNRLGVREDDFDRMMWVNLLDRDYGCSPALWDDLRGRGLSAREALITIVLGDGDSYYCDRICDEYRRCHDDWAPVLVWCVSFDLDFGGHHRFDRDDFWRDRGHDRDRWADHRPGDRDRGGRDRPSAAHITLRDRVGRDSGGTRVSEHHDRGSSFRSGGGGRGGRSSGGGGRSSGGGGRASGGGGRSSGGGGGGRR